MFFLFFCLLTILLFAIRAVADVFALDGDDAAEGDDAADEESALERFISRCCDASPESGSGHAPPSASSSPGAASPRSATAAWPRWTLLADAALIQLLNRCSAANGVDPLNLDWSAFRREVAHYAVAAPSAAPSAANALSALRGFRASRVLARAAMLLALNRLAAQALPFIPLGSPGLAPPAQILRGLFADELSAAPLGARTMSDNVEDWHVVELRDLLLTSTKQAYWASVLVATAAETSCPAEEWEDPREIKEIRVNRIAARTERLATLRPEERVRWSMLGQLRDEIEALTAGSVVSFNFFCLFLFFVAHLSSFLFLLNSSYTHVLQVEERLPHTAPRVRRVSSQRARALYLCSRARADAALTVPLPIPQRSTLLFLSFSSFFFFFLSPPPPPSPGAGTSGASTEGRSAPSRWR